MNSSRFKHLFVYLLVAICIVVIVATLVRRGPQGGATSQPPACCAPLSPFAGWLICLAPISLIVGLLVFSAIRWRQLSARMDEARFRQYSDPPGGYPDAKQPLMQLLDERGFTRLGTIAFFVSPKSPPTPSPLYVGSNGEVTVSVNSITNSLSASLLAETLYADGSLLVTTYPGSLRIRRPDYDSTFVASSPSDAIDRHLDRVREFGAVHGPVYRVTDMKSRAAWWTTYGRRHRAGWYAMLDMLTWLLPLLLTLVLMAVALNTQLFGETLGKWVLLIGYPALAGWLIWSFVIGKIRFQPANKNN